MSQDPDDLEARTTGSIRAFDPGMEPITLVDVVDDAILAEINAGPTSSPTSQPTLMIHAGVTAAPDAVMPGRAGRSPLDPVIGPEAPASPSQGRGSRSSIAPAPSIPTLEQMTRGARTSSAPPPLDPAPIVTRPGRASAPPLGPAPPLGSAPPPGYAPPLGSAPPLGHVPAASQQTLVAAGTPRGVSAAAPVPPANYVPLGDEYNQAAASYAQNIMTPPPGTLAPSQGYGQGRWHPDPAQIAAEAIRDDQARRRDAARAASQAAALADQPAVLPAEPAAAPAPARRSNTGATIVLFILSALIVAGGWAAYYFT
jgi:hypothetical protein